MRRGEHWGDPADGARTIDVHGGDAALARAVHADPDATVRFVADGTSDLARAVGLSGDPAGATVVACDALVLPDGSLAVNAVVLGIAPDRLRPWHRRRRVQVEVDGRPVGEGRATSVVIATGQFLRGADVVPQGHPGDGRAEVQVYALDPGERADMRTRLATGSHLPHTRIHQRAGRTVRVRWGPGGWRSGRWARGAWGRRGGPVEVDGERRPRAAIMDVQIRPGAVRILV